MAEQLPEGTLVGWTASDDLASFEGQRLDEYEVPGEWHELRRNGERVGRIRLDFRNGDWHVDIDGEGQPYTVHRVENERPQDG